MRKLFLSIVDALFPAKTEEKSSPKIRITPQDADMIIRFLQATAPFDNCFIAAIAPTNSMEPGIDDGMYVVLQPVPHTDLICGDIIWFETPTYRAIHRIIEIGEDSDGWYAITKGDNNSRPDARIRPQHIKGVWRATLD